MPVERFAIAVAEGNPARPAEARELGQPPIPALRVEEHPFDLLRPGSNRLLDRVEAREDQISSRSATAIAAIPSPRPLKPRPFELVPRTDTRPGATPST